MCLSVLGHAFSCGFVDNNDGYIHAFGLGGYVARFNRSRPEQHDSWQFWNGSHWQKDVHQSKHITARGEDEQGISVSKVKDKYVMFQVG